MRKHFLSLFTIAALTALVGGACGGGGGGGGVSADVAVGHAEYRKVCAICHGQNGEGMPRLGKELTGNAFVASKTDAELIAFLKEGRPANHPDNTQGVAMPPKGGNPALTDEQLGQIVDYMRALQ